MYIGFFIYLLFSQSKSRALSCQSLNLGLTHVASALLPVTFPTNYRVVELFMVASQTICINFGALKMIVHVQTSVVYLISCTYLQIVGTNQNRRGNNVNLSATCHLTLSAPIATLVMPYKNPHCTSSCCCNFGTLPEHELKSHSVILTWSCIKLHVTQAIHFHNFLQKKSFTLNCIHRF